MKKNVNKADKKKKKEVADEAVRLEEELAARQKAELDAFRPGRFGLGVTPSIPSTVAESSEDSNTTNKANVVVVASTGNNGVVEEKVAVTADGGADGQKDFNSSAPGTPKMSKARKRREKKEAEEREKQKRIEAEASVLLENSQMKAEDDIFDKMMKDLKLAIVDIKPDGNWYVNVFIWGSCLLAAPAPSRNTQ
jgi:hypothetical protein